LDLKCFQNFENQNLDLKGTQNLRVPLKTHPNPTASKTHLRRLRHIPINLFTPKITLQWNENLIIAVMGGPAVIPITIVGIKGTLQDQKAGIVSHTLRTHTPVRLEVKAIRLVHRGNLGKALEDILQAARNPNIVIRSRQRPGIILKKPRLHVHTGKVQDTAEDLAVTPRRLEMGTKTTPQGP